MMHALRRVCKLILILNDGRDVGSPLSPLPVVLGVRFGKQIVALVSYHSSYVI